MYTKMMKERKRRDKRVRGDCKNKMGREVKEKGRGEKNPIGKSLIFFFKFGVSAPYYHELLHKPELKPQLAVRNPLYFSFIFFMLVSNFFQIMFSCLLAGLIIVFLYIHLASFSTF